MVSVKKIASHIQYAWIMGVLISPAMGARAPELPIGYYTLTKSYPPTAWLNTSRPLTPADFKDRLILLSFWAYSNVNSVHVFSDLEKLQREFKADLLIIGVHAAKFTNERANESIRSAIARYAIDFPVINDSEFKIWDTFNTKQWPSFILLNAEGELVDSFEGEGNLDNLRASLRKQIKNAGASVTRESLPLRSERSRHPDTQFLYPTKLAYAADLKTLFIADSSHHQIVAARIDPPSVLYRIGIPGSPGFRDGAYDAAQFNRPMGIVYKKNQLYIADSENHRIRRIDLKSKKVSTIAGSGEADRLSEASHSGALPALQTGISSPLDLALSKEGKLLVIASAGGQQLMSLNFKSEKLTVLAGSGKIGMEDGELPLDSLAQPSAVVFDRGSVARYYFMDSASSSLRKYEGGKVTTLIGGGLSKFGFADGKRSTALLQRPLALALASDGSLLIADSDNHAIRRFDLKTSELTTILGNGKASADLDEPGGVIEVNGKILVADTNHQRIVVVDSIAKTSVPITFEEVLTAPPARAPRKGAASPRPKSHKAAKKTVKPVVKPAATPKPKN